MANNVLNFNSLQRPTLVLTMADENQTEIKVSTPSEELVEKLEASLPELQEVCKSGNREAITAIYELAAQIISCNRSFVTVTAEELRCKYNMDLESMIIFFSAYMDFINDIYRAKN